MSPIRLDEFAGMRRDLEVGLLLAPTHASAVAAAKSLAAILDAEPAVPVRLAGLAADGSRVLMTLAVTLGEVSEITTAAEPAREAVRVLDHLIDSMSAYDPAFVRLPDPASAEAQLASDVTRHADYAIVLRVVERLAALR